MPIKQIAIAAAVVLAIVIYAVTGESKSEILERAQGLFDADKYSEALLILRNWQKKEMQKHK